MEILDKKSNRMSLAIYCLELLMMQILDFLSLRNLLSNELFFYFFITLQQPLSKKIFIPFL